MTASSLLAEARDRVSIAAPADAALLVRSLVAQRQPLATVAVQRGVVDELLASLFGLGALQRLVVDPQVTELMVNGHGEVWVERQGRLSCVASVGHDEMAVIAERLLAPLGLRLDRTRPIVDARLADGSRVCVVVPPVAPDGMTMTIRRFAREAIGLHAFGSTDVVNLIHELVAHRLNIVVSGATSSGKTTLLNAVAGCAPEDRIITLEDTAELRIPCPHVVRLEARQATADGLGAVTTSDLLRAALRLRPDRIVVGEVRGDEAVDLLQALNTGHDGSLGTVHANSALDALHRLETLVHRAAPTWPTSAIRAQLHSALDVIIHVRRRSDGGRELHEIVELAPDEATMPSVRVLWSLDRGMCAARTRGRR